MFEEYRRQAPAERAGTVRKTVALAATLVFHALLIAWLGTATITVRIFPDREVRDLIIAPPDVPTYPGTPPEIVGAAAGAEVKPGAAPADNPNRAGSGGRRTTAAAPAEGSGGTGAEPADPAWVSRLSRQIDLSLGARTAGEGEPGDRLRVNLALMPGAIEPPPLRRETDEGGAGGRLMGYIRPGVPPPSAPSARSGIGGIGGGQTAEVVLPPEAYNLGPWAEQVINRIQINWFLPFMRVLPDETEVRIAVTVEKTGELSQLELTSGTSSEALDEAALTAVRSSRPFPVLPDDFPLPRLQLLFVFRYNG